MKRKNKPYFSLRKLLFVILSLIAFVAFSFPLLWMFFSSFKSNAEVFRYATPFTWKTFFPPNPTLENYLDLFLNKGFGQKIINSLYVSSMQTVLTVLVCSMAGFVYARCKFRGRDLLFGIVLVASLMPFDVVLIPLFTVINSLNLQNTLTALFLPWIASPLGIFLMRQAFKEVPKDLEDSAVVEGANLFQVYWYIMLPNIKPALTTLALLSFLWSWNTFMWPLLVIQESNKQLIQVAVALLSVPTYLPVWGEIFAAASTATVPILIIFLFLQRYYVKSSLLSGMK
jgi:ABC-type glycerol-3-phosphate transport system permease component